MTTKTDKAMAILRLLEGATIAESMQILAVTAAGILDMQPIDPGDRKAAEDLFLHQFRLAAVKGGAK